MRFTTPVKVSLIVIFSFSLSWCVDLQQLAQLEKMSNNSSSVNNQNNDFFSERNYINSYNSVDENTYYVGCGDEFSLFFTDFASIFYSGAINQNGDIFIPGLGSLFIGKISLKDAKQKITTYFSAKNKKTINVSFSKAKNASITITGIVLNPGSFQISSTMRVLDAIKLANNNKLPSLLEFNSRSVEVRSIDTTNYYDILKSIHCSDLSQNPYLYPGDNIIIKPVQSQIYLSGEIKPVTGMIPILPNEDIDSFLKIFSLSDAADFENIIVQRIISSKERSLIKISSNKLQGFLLKDRDIIIVSKKNNYPDIDIASVTGEIKSPGEYPIIKGLVKAKDLISLAGDATSFGDLKRAVIIRREKDLSEGMNVPTIRPVMSSALNSMKLGKDYSIIKLENNDVTVEPGDQIFVPKNDQFVYVSGSVKNPGGMRYQSGKDIFYYINQAGGFSKRADKHNLSVMTSYDNTVVTKDNGIVEQGDIILVPVSQDQRVFSSIVVPLISTIATTVTIILAIYSTTK